MIMKHEHDDTHESLYANLQRLSSKPPAIGGASAALADDDGLEGPRLSVNQRLDLDVECWGHRIA